MSESEHSVNKNPRKRVSASPATIRSLINDLGSKIKDVRDKAHRSIISIGKPTVRSLVQALANPNEQVRWEASKILDEIGITWSSHANVETINALIDDLTSKDGRVRVRARRSLVAIGGKAVTALEEALKSKEEWKRWEAAKALGQIGDPVAVGALVRALEDEIFDVRWLAGEGLIAIGKPSLVPLLHMLIEHSDSVWLREGAHHVLHDIHEKNLKVMLQPVLGALEDGETHLELPFAAEAALKSLD